MPKLIVKHPERGEMTFPLSGERISVGRRGDNQIQINHGTISGHHAELVAVNGHYLLRDLDSTNHCFVDGFQVTEADLSDRCNLMIGTIECEFVPDDAVAATTDVDNLRKTVGLLRHQNEELVSKLNEQQNQIDILGSARLLTGAAGADLRGLREKVTTLTSERERLQKENHTLHAEVERLRGLVAHNGEASSLKATVPIVLPTHDATVSVGPGGVTTLAAPMAKVVLRDPVVEVSPQLVEFTAQASALVAELNKEPTNADLRSALAGVTERLAERSAVIAGHPVARLLAGFDGFVRDLGHRPDPGEASVGETLTATTGLLGKVLAPELLHRAKELPVPHVLAFSNDEYLLPGMVAALEFARFQVSSCTSGDKAMSLMRDGAFDLLLLGSELPGATAEDCCAGMRADPALSDVPVIAVTESPGAACAGVVDRLAKPVNLFELALKANVCVLRHQLQLA